MKYLYESCGSRLLPKLIGSYELELFPWLQRLFQQPFRQIIDVGCAEGYYAIGFAVRFPNAQILAYDISPDAQEICRNMARKNGVSERVSTAGECTPQLLARMDLTDTLLMSDCEGYEKTLLDPAAAPSLARCTILVETHETVVPDVVDVIKQRFAATHTIEIVCEQRRNPDGYPMIADFTSEQRAYAVSEERSWPTKWPDPQRWMLLTPNRAPK
jgi:ribosomal protein L11 methylase PrmA